MKGVVAQVGPKPCIGAGEGEASAGESVGQPLSRESDLTRHADAVSVAEGNTGGCAIASTRSMQSVGLHRLSSECELISRRSLLHP